MLQNLKNKQRQEGFTIIEVMIVLVIAAVILLIVFLAVPALQRNSRNARRADDAGKLLAAASEYAANNNTVPGAGQMAAINGLANLSAGANGAWGAGAPAAPDTFNLSVGAKCNGDANPRATTVRYKVETNSGTIDVCKDSGI